ncbi:MAG: hypothetical protein HY039_06710 [Nitrospirae bacterium]|nr:hypothetical protein [Nitrospirota bacterium]
MLIDRIEREDIEALAESPVFRSLSAEERWALAEDVLIRYGAGTVESSSANSQKGGTGHGA